MHHAKKLLLATVAALSFAASAQAADISFTGNLAGPNDVLSFNFTTTSTSEIVLRSYSYAGGTNAAGTMIARGGFDPILSLYNSLGNRIGQQDDAGDDGRVVPEDAVTGFRYDVNYAQTIAAGTYTVLLTAYANFCGDTVAAGCPGGGTFNSRDSHFAFDILNVNSATQTGGGVAVPEPMSLSLFGAGLLGLGFTRRWKGSRPSA